MAGCRRIGVSSVATNPTTSASFDPTSTMDDGTFDELARPAGFDADQTGDRDVTDQSGRKSALPAGR